MPPRLIVDDLGVFLVALVLTGTRRVLQFGDRVGRPHVLFTTHAEGVFTAGIEHGSQHRISAESLPMLAN